MNPPAPIQRILDSSTLLLGGAANGAVYAETGTVNPWVLIVSLVCYAYVQGKKYESGAQ